MSRSARPLPAGPSVGILLGGDSTASLDSVNFTLGSAGSGGTTAGSVPPAAPGATSHSP